MDSGIYKDFRSDAPNTVWVLTKEIASPTVFRQETLNHVIAGDTDSAMLKLPDSITEGLTVDDAVQIADVATEMVNEQYPDFGKFAFNIPEERRWMFNSDREKVSDSSFFSTKKRYAMRVVDNEGSREVKTVFVGLEIVKSDTTNVEKELLTELVTMILDDRSMDEVKDRIEDYKRDFKSYPFVDIAKPSSVNTLAKATEQYRTTGTTKSIHYAAKAALIWNLEKGDDDPEIYPGEKVGILYVKGMPYNAIAFPIDMKTFPEWFKKIPIDYDKMWKKSEKKVTSYLSVMRWDRKSQQEDKRKDIFGF